MIHTGWRPGKLEPRGFGEAAHQVQALDGVPGRPLDEVIDGAQHDQARGITLFFEPDLAEVRPLEDLGLGIAVEALGLLDDPDERPAGVLGPLAPPRHPSPGGRSFRLWVWMVTRIPRTISMAVAEISSRTGPPTASRTRPISAAWRWPVGL